LGLSFLRQFVADIGGTVGDARKDRAEVARLGALSAAPEELSRSLDGAHLLCDSRGDPGGVANVVEMA